MLVTGAGGPAAVAALLDLPDTVEWVAADVDPHAAGLYLVPPERRVLVPRGDDPALVGTLLRACAEHRVEVLWPTADAELLPVALAAEEFAAAGVRVLAAPAAALALCLDRWQLARRCRLAVQVPETAPYTAASRIGPLPKVLRPRTGSGGTRVLHGPEDLAGVPRDGSFLLQELLPGDEYAVDVLCRPDGSVAAAVPRRRDRVVSGLAVAGRTVRDAELADLGAAVATAVGLTGVASVRVRRDRRGRPALLGVRPRLPGGTPLTVAAGVDLPAWALHAALDGEIPAELPWREVALVRHWAGQVVAVSEVDDLTAAAARPAPRPVARPA